MGSILTRKNPQFCQRSEMKLTYENVKYFKDEENVELKTLRMLVSGKMHLLKSVNLIETYKDIQFEL